MKWINYIIIGLILIGLVSAVPLTLNKQGVLRNSTDNSLLDGVFDINVSLFKISDNSKVYSEKTSVSLNNGVFDYQIGVLTPFISSIFADNLYMVTRVGSEDLNAVNLTSVPYSIYSINCNDSSYLDGQPASYYISAAGNNNYTTNITVTGTSTKTITLERYGMSNLTAIFTDIDTNTNTEKSGDGTYTYNDSSKIYFNSTYAGLNLKVNASDYWQGINTFSGLNYMILLYYLNITGRPTHLSNFTNDLDLKDSTWLNATFYNKAYVNTMILNNKTAINTLTDSKIIGNMTTVRGWITNNMTTVYSKTATDLRIINNRTAINLKTDNKVNGNKTVINTLTNTKITGNMTKVRAWITGNMTTVYTKTATDLRIVNNRTAISTLTNTKITGNVTATKTWANAQFYNSSENAKFVDLNSTGVFCVKSFCFVDNGTHLIVG